MHFPYSPIVATILAAAIPAFPLMVSAATIPPILIDDPDGNTSMEVFPGVNITVNTGEAIRVNNQGNSIFASGITVTAEEDGRGAHAQGGGTITITDSTIQTQAGAALSASQENSFVHADISLISSEATTVLATDAGRIELLGGTVSGSGGFQATIRASDGGVITATDLEIKSIDRNGVTSYGVRAQSGGRVELSNVILSSADEMGTATGANISVQDADFMMTDTHVKAGSVTGDAASLHVSGSAVATVQGSVIEGGVTASDGATLSMVDSVVGGPHSVLIGVYLLGTTASTVSLDNVTIGSEAGVFTDGVVGRANQVINAQDVDIRANRYAIRTVNGSAQVQGGTLRAGRAGLYAFSEDDTAPTTIVAVGTHVLVEANNAVGASAAQRGAHVSLDGVTVDVSGTGGTGLQATDAARIDAVNSQLNGQSTNSTGVQLLGNIASGDTAVSLSDTQVVMTGQNANGVQSVRYEPQGANSVVLSDGSDLQTHDGVGFLVRGGDHDITVQNATVVARAGGDEASGILLGTQATPGVGIAPGQPYQTQRVTLNAIGGLMTGDVLTSDSGRIDIDLASGSEWTGAVRAGQGSVDSVLIDASSAWNMRGDSAVKTLINAGVVRFVSPDAQSGFKTLTVSDYIGGGTLVMNTHLGDDTSLTDRLVVDGGAVMGTTGLRVLNAGGAGASTTQGIRLVQAANGATISGNAFYLDANSTGYRPSTISLALNGYEYFLVQGGAGGVASDWYLTSSTPPGSGIETPPGNGTETPPGSGIETPPGSGTETPPGSGTETPPGSGTETPPGSGIETPPGSGTETPPGSGTETPPGSGTETPPGSGIETPPGSGTETPPGSGIETPPGSGTETPPGSGIETPPGSGTETPPGSGIETPPGSGTETPPGSGIETPPGSGTETPPGSGIETPPGGGTETPPGSGIETPPGSGTETPPGSGIETPPGGGTETPPGSGIETPPGSGTETSPGSGVTTPPGSGGGSAASAPGNLQNVSPENGVHIGNQFAATRMFVHRLADRTVAQTSAGQSAPGSASRQLWARTEGARHTGMKLQEGQVSIDTDTAMLQMGADLVSTRLGQQGVLKAGVMAGAGEARTNATSQLIHPGTGMAMRADARGKVTGYSVGIYATAYADDATRLGAYADTWLQFGRYSNEINSDLGSARYRSNTWTASVEAGYALKPFAADSALGAMVVVPQAQLAYTRYNAQDAVLPSMTLKNSPASSVNSRVGVRVYPLGNDAAASPARPYVEANWLHNSGSAKANVGASTFQATPMRDAAELRIGVAGNVRESWQVSGELFGQAGNGGQRGYGGMLNVGYRW
ncbi:autotransporter outer membrane beta-barrel domain-containing protein [Achromobacter mucicolens]|uniref:autotransporter outer membrane beta-barrel domain-containing protein n=1 Tax=Achromobacter mucicolens TaxID=1389922 RepID=UPI00197AEA18|nr:autotransporter outer membrane beta-barrel domain-containing protein [Achromobacter mucicolens]